MNAANWIFAVILAFGLCVPSAAAGSVTVKNGQLNATGNLYAGFDGLFVNSVLGRVGIGTLNPQARLDVNGTSKFGGIMNLSNNRIVGLAAPINETDAATKGYVDAAGSSGGNTTVLFNSTLNVGMPLQGIQTLYQSDSAAISTVPIALPVSGCSVKITACGSTPPVKMILGADPVVRRTKTRINEAIGVHSINGRSMTGTGVQCGTGTQCDPSTGCWGVYTYCPYITDICLIGTSCCSPTDNDATTTQCSNCTTRGYLSDWEDSTCYKEPRCPTADAGTTYIVEDDTNNVCVYCPHDHPTYDPNLKTCIKNATINTNPISARCSTLSTTLSTTITDVTFANGAGSAIDCATSVSIAYSCPVD